MLPSSSSLDICIIGLNLTHLILLSILLHCAALIIFLDGCWGMSRLWGISLMVVLSVLTVDGVGVIMGSTPYLGLTF